jgi:hypothetical protein
MTSGRSCLARNSFWSSGDKNVARILFCCGIEASSRLGEKNGDVPLSGTVDACPPATAVEEEEGEGRSARGVAVVSMEHREDGCAWGDAVGSMSSRRFADSRRQESVEAIVRSADVIRAAISSLEGATWEARDACPRPGGGVGRVERFQPPNRAAEQLIGWSAAESESPPPSAPSNDVAAEGWVRESDWGSPTEDPVVAVAAPSIVRGRGKDPS